MYITGHINQTQVITYMPKVTGSAAKRSTLRFEDPYKNVTFEGCVDINNSVLIELYAEDIKRKIKDCKNKIKIWNDTIKSTRATYKSKIVTEKKKEHTLRRYRKFKCDNCNTLFKTKACLDTHKKRSKDPLWKYHSICIKKSFSRSEYLEQEMDSVISRNKQCIDFYKDTVIPSIVDLLNRVKEHIKTVKVIINV